MPHDVIELSTGSLSAISNQRLAQFKRAAQSRRMNLYFGEWQADPSITAAVELRDQIAWCVDCQLSSVGAKEIAAFLRSNFGPVEGESSRSDPQPPNYPPTSSTDAEWQKMLEALDSYNQLTDGWNGYSAPAPERTAVRSARTFLQERNIPGLRPSRVKPSAVGGVGITFRSGTRRAYVEFYNNGTVYVLFSEPDREPETRPVPPTPSDYRQLWMEIRDYLNG